MTQTSKTAVEGSGKQRVPRIRTCIQHAERHLLQYPHPHTPLPTLRDYGDASWSRKNTTTRKGKKANPRGGRKTRDTEAVIPPHPRRLTGAAGLRFMFEKDKTQKTVATARLGRGAAFIRKRHKLLLHPSPVMGGGRGVAR